MDFYSAYAHGFARVAACTLPVAIADPAANARAVLAQAKECDDNAVAVAVFPELCLTGYAIDDLLLQDTLLEAAHDALHEVVRGTADLLPVLVVGLPLVHGTRVLNCAAVVHKGRLLGISGAAHRTSLCASRAHSTHLAALPSLGDGPTAPSLRRLAMHAL